MTKKTTKLLIGSIVALLALGFIVLPQAAQAAPSVIFANPPDGQPGVGLNSPITFSFNEPMDSATLNSSTILVSGTLSGPISAAIEVRGQTFCVFNPARNPIFIGTEIITATVTTGAENVAGEGLSSNYVISFTVEGEIPHPNSPTNLVAKDTPGDEGKSIGLSWQVSTSPGVTGYIIYRSLNPAGLCNSNNRLDVIGKKTSYVDETVLDDTIYYYGVKAKNTKKESLDYSQASASAKENISPSSITGLKATSLDRRVVLSWTNPQDSDLAGVRILRRTDRYPANIYDGEVIYSAKSTYYEDSGLTNNITYYYALYAYDTSDNYSSRARMKAAPKAKDEIPDQGEPEEEEEEPREDEPKEEEPKQEEPKQEQKERPKEETPPAEESPKEETPTEESPQEETPVPAPTPFSVPAPIVKVVERVIDSPSAPSEPEGEVAGEETDATEEATKEEPAEEETKEEVSEEKKEGLMGKAKATLISFFKPESLPLTIIIVMFAAGIVLYLFSYKRKKRIMR